MPTIRRASVDDIETVVQLRLAFLRDMSPDLDEASVLEATREYVSANLPTGEFLVWFAEKHGEIVGTSGLIFFHRPPMAHYHSDLHPYILNMYTLPEWRNRGIASLLLQHMIEHVKTTPADRITLHATEAGRPVYERLGFVSHTSAMVLNLDGDDIEGAVGTRI